MTRIPHEVESKLVDRLLDCLLMFSLDCLFCLGCTSDRDISKPQLDPSLAACYLQKSCTGVQCCVSVPQTGLSVEAFVEVSPCNRQLRVGIENLKFNKSLYGYKFGEKEKFDLFGVVVVE